MGTQWHMVLPEVDLRIPPDQLVVRPGVDYLSQGRRQVTTGTTAYQDVIDRPEIHVVSSRLVSVHDQLAIVGELRNDDVDPAYVTVTADLMGKDGTKLTSYSASIASAHTVLPGEVMPFRIDFEGVAGKDPNTPVADVTFDPYARTSIDIDLTKLAQVNLYAKAVVTASGLDRSLVAQGVTINDGRHPTIDGTLRADGLSEITVPNVIVTLRNPDGSVGWVDHAFQRVAIRPQRSQPFSLAITPESQVRAIDAPIQTFTNGIPQPGQQVIPPALGSVGGWSSADLTLTAFIRDPG